MTRKEVTRQEMIDGSLLLRPWHEGDAAGLVEAVSESLATVGCWLPWCRDGYDSAKADAWIVHCREGWQRGDHFAFGVFDRSTGVVLGSAGMNQCNTGHRSANLGYWVRYSRQREGIAGRAGRMVARFGFEQLALVRIEIVALPDNVASRHTAECIGARFEAIARHRLMDDGQPRDGAVYALLPSDLPSELNAPDA